MKHTISFILALSLSVCAYSGNVADTVCIENAAVRAFLADDTYDWDFDYSHSVIRKYNNESKYGNGEHLDRPVGYEVKWTKAFSKSSISEVRIELSNDEQFQKVTVYHPKDGVGVSSYIICNMYPDRDYFYRVIEVPRTGSPAQVASGSFHTVGHVRMLRISGVRNVRDIGGWMTSFGCRIRYGLIYRSGNLDNIQTVGKEDFLSEGIGAELDLRDDSKLTQSKLGSKVEFTIIPTIHYLEGVTGSPETLVRDVEWIIDRVNKGIPVDFHCRLGADRGGSVSFLIEGLLGMSEPDLSRDYELTCFGEEERTRSYSSSHGYGSFGDMVNEIKKYADADNPDNFTSAFYNYLIFRGIPAAKLDEFRETMLGPGYDSNTGVQETRSRSSQTVEVYSISGKYLDGGIESDEVRGLKIVKYPDGSVGKLFHR